MGHTGFAHLGGLWASDVEVISNDLSDLDTLGRWAVVAPYAGKPVLAKFRTWEESPPRSAAQDWKGLGGAPWSTSLDESAYVAGVARIREAIARGDVYQVNLCRVLTAPVAAGISLAALHRRLNQVHPAPYAGFLSLPDVDLEVVCASPELFLRRDGTQLTTGPIKGTAATQDLLQPKDQAENIMIVDLMRNDLSRIAQTGSVKVLDLLRVEQHPGLVQLVSDITCHVESNLGWDQIMKSTFPPGSVTGAPKSSALAIIDELEPASRDVYCGAFGWVDADTQQAELAVAIRTFWRRDGLLRFGTGAGITWGSNPNLEWRETVLKADRLCRWANGSEERLEVRT